MNSQLGKSIYELETPALIIDLDIFERNVQKMSKKIISDQSIRWRPHIKSIKYPELVKYLLRAGARGVTCANVDEAARMVRSGIYDILIANQIVSLSKLEKIYELSKISKICIAVDSKECIDIISNYFEHRNAQLEIVIEVNTGLNRSGVNNDEAIEIIRYAIDKVGVKIIGLMTWEAHVLDEKNISIKTSMVKSSITHLKNIIKNSQSIGLYLEIISCGGSGTYWLDCYINEITEMQAGGGVLGDLQYLNKYGVPLEVSLFVLSTIVSKPNATRIICDSGRKYLSNHYPPSINGDVKTSLIGLSAEHCRVELEAPNPNLKIGNKIKFLVGDCDMTMHLHNRLFGCRNEIVEKEFVYQ